MVTSPKNLSCICGSDEHYQYNKQLYEVTEKGVTQKAESNGVHFVKCEECGTVRQLNPPYLNDVEYKYYYKQYPPVGNKYEVKDYDHDRELAKLRCKEYGLKYFSEEIMLDVGSGSGAFVDECRSMGIEAYGCEIGEYHYQNGGEFIYRKRLEDIHFPVDHFDKITCHDVLEHTIDPIEFLCEMFRVLKQRGECIIDFPAFFEDEGKHHWKQEHIWFFRFEQLSKILSDIGFEIIRINKPVPSKLVFYLKKPKQNRVKILVPPGMGDAYWSIVKLESFMEEMELGDIADIYVACNKERQFNGHRRAFPFIKLFPFTKSTGITYTTDDYPQSLWLEAYRNCGRTIFEDVCGCDYFLSWNAYMGAGYKLEERDSEFKCNWIPDMFESLEQINYQKNAEKQYGEYIVFYFIFHGHYAGWLSEFPLDAVVDSVRQIARETGCTPVFAGAVWDEKNDVLSQVVDQLPECIDLRGKTSIEQLFGLIKGSEIVVGYPSGLTIMSTVLKAKTLMIWNKFYNDDFRWNSCPPQVRNKTYFVEDTKGLTPQKLTDRVKQIIERYVPKEGDERLL